MKKNFICFLLFLIFINCSNSRISEKKYPYIEIEYVDMDILTPFRINCPDFEFQFEKHIKVQSVSDSVMISEIIILLDELPIHTLYPDTRMKLKIYNDSNKFQEICIGKFTVLKNNKVYLYTDELKNILNKLINNE